MGMFLVSVRILYHPAVPTVSLVTVLLLHLLFSTSSGRRNIHLYHFCVLHLEYPL